MKNGLKHGIGVLENSDCNLKYEGSFLDDQFHGHGTSFMLNGKIKYEGDWYKGRRTGKGCEKTSEYTYVGTFKDS